MGSSEDDMPLLKYPQQKPTAGEKGPNTETHILAQYVEQRNGKTKKWQAKRTEDFNPLGK